MHILDNCVKNNYILNEERVVKNTIRGGGGLISENKKSENPSSARGRTGPRGKNNILHRSVQFIISVKWFKASAHSFKRFASRLLKLTSLYAHIYLEWTSCLISFAWDQSTCQERVGNDKIQNEKSLPTAGLEPSTLRLEV